MKFRGVGVFATGSLLAVVFVLALSFQVGSAEMSAYDIMKKSNDLLDQAKDSQTTMTMTLLNDKGQKRERSVSASVKKYGKGNSKSILFFNSPSDVKGTSFLIWAEEGKEDKQWLYMPADQRVRRISTSGRGERFMGTEFTFYDMGSHDIDDFTYTLLKDENVDGELCYSIQVLPKKPEFYSKAVVWVRKGNFIPARADFYNMKGEYEKQGKFSQVKNIQGINTPTHVEMRNLKNNCTTILELSNILYDKGLKDDIFTERYMKRGN